MKKSLSIIVPSYNEEKNLPLLYNKITEVLVKNSIVNYEIIFVDDGSRDNTHRVMEKLRSVDNNVKVIKFQNNFGKSAAIDAGFKEASKDYIITMDADLQDDPREIPRFLKMHDKGYDMVSGWKYKRKDPLAKKAPSRVFNFLASRLTGVNIHDFNCGFKSYKRVVAKNLSIYGDLHRYIPALADMKGFRVGEIKVKHHKRRFGKSKYGFSRLFKGVFDLITITFFMKFAKSPLHFFGFFGIGSFFLGSLGWMYLLYVKLLGQAIGNRPIMILSTLLVIIGIQFFSFGLLGELLIKNNYQVDYVIEKVSKNK